MRKDRPDIIAIPTFNRVRHLVACLASLRRASGLERYRIFIRDDASREFGVNEIARLVPEAESIERNSVNLGPDANQILLFRDCIEAGARRILVLDSDMIVSPSILEFTERTFERTDGFLGLYNSTLHKERQEVDRALIAKWRAGGTATCWQVDLMRRVIDRCEGNLKTTWDWIANAKLRETETRILVSRRSYAQHLGIVGTNNGSFGNIDYGRGFVIETEEQARFMAETFDHLMSRQSQFAVSERSTRRGPRLLERSKEFGSVEAIPSRNDRWSTGVSAPSREAAGDRDSKPVILFYNDFFGHPPDTRSLTHIDNCTFSTDRRDLSRASAVVFHIPTMRKLGRVLKRRGQLWIAWSMESEVNYPLLADQPFMRKFDLTMTYSRSADIWCPYLPGISAFEEALAAPIPAKDAGAPLVMFQSSPIDRSGRNTYVLELMKHVGLHSYGNFLKNRPLMMEDRGRETKLSVIAGYKFCIGFENSIASDYVTEKFYDPFLAGTVPVYLGAPNVDRFAPGENAFIDVSRFSGPQDLAQFLRRLASDERAYREYFKWRESGFSTEFVQLLSAASKDPFCRLAEIVVARASTPSGRRRWPWSLWTRNFAS